MDDDELYDQRVEAFSRLTDAATRLTRGDPQAMSDAVDALNMIQSLVAPPPPPPPMAIPLLDFAISFRDCITPRLAGIHELGAAMIGQWLEEMCRAADQNRGSDVKRIIRDTTHKLRQEEHWASGGTEWLPHPDD